MPVYTISSPISLRHMFELFSCFEYQIYKKGKFSIKLCKKVIMATCCFNSFNDKLVCAKSQSYVHIGTFTSNLKLYY